MRKIVASFLFCLLSLVIFCSNVMALSEQECKEQEGEWKQAGLLGNYTCILKTKDAGKPCNDSSECESVCVVPEGGEVDPESEKKGVCHDKNTQLGTCMARVVKGEVTPVLCLD